MKHFSAVCLAVCLMATFYSNAQKGMQGAYLMTKQVMNTGVGDSVSSLQQMKLFTDRYMIYAHALPGDSLAGYGIGTYKTTKDGIVENVFHTGSGGAHNDTFQVKIERTNTGFEQRISFTDSAGNKLLLTEYYNNVGKNTTSPLDGAWKQTHQTYTPKNGTTVKEMNPLQFKVFQSGNFIWVNTHTDSATKKPISAFGYGTFEMMGKNAVKETNAKSTFASELVGKPVTLQLEFTGKDSYKQTIVYSNGGQSVEYYERLK